MFRFVLALGAVVVLGMLALGSTGRASADQPIQLWLPWEGGSLWTYTQGPHGADLEALDLQPPDAAGKPCETFHSSFWVTAAADGIVTVIPNAIEIDHGNGFQTAYYHLEDRQVKTGDHVTAGERLGAPGCCPDGVGADNCEATAPHVHFYVSLNGVRQPAFGLNLGGWIVAPDGCLARGAERSCPLEGGGATGFGRIVSNSPRRGQDDPSTPADIAVMIDDSAGVAENQTSAQEAALAILQATRPDDQVAVINFNRTARVTAGLQPAVVDGAVNADLAAAAQPDPSSEPTNIRLGMVTGCAELLEHGRNPAKAAVLLSDGNHEVGGFSGAIECFKEAGIPVFTYGVGASNQAFLTDIAQQTGGQFAFLAAAANPYCEFRRVRAVISGDPIGDCTTFELRQNEALTLPFSVPSGQDQASLEIRWRDRRTAEEVAAEGEPVTATLVSPGGTTLELPYPGIKLDKDDGAFRYTIARPLSGQWTLIVDLNDNAPAEGLFVTFSASTIPQALPFIDVAAAEPEPTADPAAATPDQQTATPAPAATGDTPTPDPMSLPTPTATPTPTPSPPATPTPRVTDTLER